MSCYDYSSNDPIYLEPGANPWSIEVEYTVGQVYSYASIARLCDIPAADQLCVFFKTGTTETQKQLGTDYTVNVSTEVITLIASTSGVEKVIIRRCTPNNKLLVNFVEGAKLTSQQLNLVTHQLLFISQEKQFKNATITAIYPFMASSWASTTSYNAGDYVTYSISGTTRTYRALITNVNIAPQATSTSTWDVISTVNTTTGFIVNGPTSLPVTFDLSQITTGQTLKWESNKFVPTDLAVDAIIPSGYITNVMLKQTSGEEAVSTSTIRNSAITTAKILDSAVTAVKLGTGAVTTAKILNTPFNEFASSGAITTRSNLTVTGTLSAGGQTVIPGGNFQSNEVYLTAANTTVTGNLTVNGNITGNLVLTSPIAFGGNVTIDNGFGSSRDFYGVRAWAHVFGLQVSNLVWTRNSNGLITVTAPNWGFSPGHIIWCNFSNASQANGKFTVISSTATTFTIQGSGGAVSGTSNTLNVDGWVIEGRNISYVQRQAVGIYKVVFDQPIDGSYIPTLTGMESSDGSGSGPVQMCVRGPSSSVGEGVYYNPNDFTIRAYPFASSGSSDIRRIFLTVVR